MIKKINEAQQRAGDTAEPGRLEPATLDALGVKLRQNYQQVVDEGIPTKFVELLQKLKKSETGNVGE